MYNPPPTLQAEWGADLVSCIGEKAAHHYDALLPTFLSELSRCVAEEQTGPVLMNIVNVK